MSLFSGENPSLGDTTTVNGNKVQNVAHVVFSLNTGIGAAGNVFLAAVPYKVVSATVAMISNPGAGATFALEVIPSGVANSAGAATVFATPLALNTPTVYTSQKVPLGVGTTIPAGSRLGFILGGNYSNMNGTLQLALVRV